MPSVQLGISVYGQSLRHLHECIESCLRQKSEQFKLFISIRIDGGGEEAAGSDVRSYLRELAGQEADLSLVEGRERLGTFGSYREIFSCSQSDYLCQVDADDVLAPAALERSIKLIDAYEGASLLYTDCIDMDVDGCPIRLSERQSLPYSEQNILVQFMTFHLRVVRREAYRSVGGYDSSLKYVGDYDLSLKLSEVGDVIYLKRPLYFYRVHDSSESQKYRREVDWESFKVARSALRRRELDSQYSLIQHHDGSMHLKSLS